MGGHRGLHVRPADGRVGQLPLHLRGAALYVRRPRGGRDEDDAPAARLKQRQERIDHALAALRRVGSREAIIEAATK